MIKAILFLFFVFLGLSWTPPTFNYSYQIPLTELNFVRTTPHYSQGQLFYDPLHHRQRVDLQDGQHNPICGSILPGVNTSCISLIADTKRWQIFPERSQCCLCCQSYKGCGMTQPDWLKNAEYLGNGQIDQQRIYDVWAVTGTNDKN